MPLMSDDKISLEHFILNAYQELVSKAYPKFRAVMACALRI